MKRYYSINFYFRIASSLVPLTIPYKIVQPLPSQSGLYYDKISQLTVADGSWKLIVYKDLSPLFLSRNSLKQLSKNFHITVSNYNFSLPITRSTNSFLKHSLSKIDSRFSEFAYYLGRNSRTKRELIDGLSSVLKWLIGTPDAKDATRYNECITKLENNELDLAKMMAEQIQVTSK